MLPSLRATTRVVMPPLQITSSQTLTLSGRDQSFFVPGDYIVFRMGLLVADDLLLKPRNELLVTLVLINAKTGEIKAILDKPDETVSVDRVDYSYDTVWQSEPVREGDQRTFDALGVYGCRWIVRSYHELEPFAVSDIHWFRLDLPHGFAVLG
jgi:hypothetical protein